MSAIQVEIKDGKAYIASPYNVEFVRRIKRSGGRRRPAKVLTPNVKTLRCWQRN